MAYRTLINFGKGLLNYAFDIINYDLVNIYILIGKTSIHSQATLRVRLDESFLKKLQHKIRTDTPSSAWFDEAQAKVRF